jgi:hypothetical protein
MLFLILFTAAQAAASDCPANAANPMNHSIFCIASEKIRSHHAKHMRVIECTEIGVTEEECGKRQMNFHWNGTYGECREFTRQEIKDAIERAYKISVEENPGCEDPDLPIGSPAYTEACKKLDFAVYERVCPSNSETNLYDSHPVCQEWLSEGI